MSVLITRDRHGIAMGIDPWSISPEVLAANGHPKRTLQQVGRAFARTAAGQPDTDLFPHHVKTYADIREHCDGCGEGPADARRCCVTSCPF